MDNTLNNIFEFDEYKRYKLTEELMIKLSDIDSNIQIIFNKCIQYILLEDINDEFYILKTDIELIQNYNKLDYFEIKYMNQQYDIYKYENIIYINELSISSEKRVFSDWIGTNHFNKTILYYKSMLIDKKMIIQIKNNYFLHIKFAIVFANWVSKVSSFNLISLFEQICVIPNFIVNNSIKEYKLKYEDNIIQLIDNDNIIKFNKQITISKSKINEFNKEYSKNKNKENNKIKMFYNKITLINKTTELELIQIVDNYFNV